MSRIRHGAHGFEVLSQGRYQCLQAFGKDIVIFGKLHQVLTLIETLAADSGFDSSSYPGFRHGHPNKMK
jgi:hypothetical protein